MNKIAENKTRKKLRITLCILYLFEIVLCTMPYIQYIDPDTGVLSSLSVFDMISYLGASFSDAALGKSLTQAALFMIVLIIIPIVGFFFCALDKERNLKNVVSLICCLLGVISILFVVTGSTISLGSMLGLLLYLLICFLTTFSIFARYAKSPDEQ